MGMCLGRGYRHHGEWHSSAYPSSYPASHYDDYPPISSGAVPVVTGVSGHVNPRYAGDDYYYNGGVTSGAYLHEDRVRPVSMGHHSYHSGRTYRDGAYHDPYY